MIILGIIVAILIFTIIVMIHEWGHFQSARFFWVKVHEFWLGLPPRAKKIFTDKKWTLFSLNWLPFWGFVKLAWETPITFYLYDENKKFLNNQDLEVFIKQGKNIFSKDWEKISENDKKEILEILEENKKDYNLSKKSWWKQSIIILAWIFMNFVLAFFIFFVLFLVWVKPIWINTKIDTNLELKLLPTFKQAIEKWVLIKKDWVIVNPTSWSLAEKSWLQKWDIITEINSEKINSIEEFRKILSENKNNEIEVQIICWENCQKKSKIKIWEDWLFWAYISENISKNENFQYKYSFTDSTKYAFLETKNQVLMTFKWIWLLVKNIFFPETEKQKQEAIEQMSWPIWIVNFISNTLEAWFVFLLVIWAIISINLWVFNLLPIPALDGWRFLFIILNSLCKAIFRKKFLTENIENIIHLSFFAILFALSLIIAYNDISKIIW